MSKIKKFDELFKVGSAKRVLKSQWKNEGVPFYRGREITKLSIDGLVNNQLFITKSHFEQLKEKHGVPKAGDIMITAIGTIGNTYIVKNNDRFYFKDASVLWLNKTSDILSEYIDYFINSDLFKSQLDANRGATVDSLTIKKLSSIEIMVPSIEKQQRIVAKLDVAFSEIDKMSKIIVKKTENIKKFNSKLTSELLNKLSKADSKKLSSICTLTRGPFGGSLTKQIFVNNGYAVYEQKHAIRNNFENIKYFITEKKFSEMKRFELRSGDLLMSCSGTMGKVAIVPKNIKKGIINQALLKITPNENIILKEYFKLIISSNYFQKILMSLSSGAAQVNVPSIKILKDIDIPVPSIDMQKVILEKIIIIENLQLENLYTKKKILVESLRSSIIKSLITQSKKAA